MFPGEGPYLLNCIDDTYKYIDLCLVKGDLWSQKVFLKITEGNHVKSSRFFWICVALIDEYKQINNQ